MRIFGMHYANMTMNNS